MRTTTLGRWAPIIVLGLLLPLLLSPSSDASEAGPAVTAPVTGRVLDAAGAPVVGVDVRAFQRWATGSFRTEAETVTDADGRYWMDLEPGTYRILFEPRYGSNLADEYWGGVYSFAFAQDEIPTFAIEEGTPVPDKDIVLDATATITGSVLSTDPTVELSPGAAVFREVNGEWLRAGGSTPDPGLPPHQYRIAGLPPGTYRIAFGGSSFISQFWPGTPTVESATDVTVAAGSVTTGVDARLDPYGRIVGRLVNAAGQGVPNFPVHVVGIGGPAGYWSVEVSTDARGYYDVNAIPSARYTLRFGGGLQPCDGEYYYDQEGESGAEEIAIPMFATHTVIVQAKTQTLTCHLKATKEPEPFGFDLIQVGTPVGAVPPEFDVPGVEISYQWYRIGFGIPGADDFWYLPGFDDVPHLLALQVTATRPGFYPTGWEYEGNVYPGTIRSKVFPRIKGTPQVGAMLRVTRGRWSPEDVLLRYRWLADGKVIKGAHGKTLSLKRGQLGKRISVRFVAWTRDGSYLAREFFTKGTKPVVR